MCKNLSLKIIGLKKTMLEIDQITVPEVPCVLEDNSKTLDLLKRCAQSSNNKNERKEAVDRLAN